MGNLKTMAGIALGSAAILAYGWVLLGICGVAAGGNDDLTASFRAVIDFIN